ncbi:MAG TPA: glycosyltransferase [Actinomycetota bacterium]|nr:glycosyltransferase [Actinomycetota bacterium]
MSSQVGVVIATRNRAAGLVTTLQKLRELPEQPAVVVVDNASTDDSALTAAGRFPDVKVLRLPANIGAAARTVGVEALDTPYVAFCDDDSWWAPGSLEEAARTFDAHPDLGLVAARVLVGEREEVDPTCLQMANSPLGRAPALPGPRILGFIACGAIVRREAYLQAGGFHAHFGIGGEEDHLALNLAASGWELVYVDHLTAYHHPSSIRDREARTEIITRNSLWTTWLLRSPSVVAKSTLTALATAAFNGRARRGVVQAVRGLPWVFRERNELPVDVESMARRLSRSGG